MNISLSPEILFHLWSFPVTNALLWSFFLSFSLIFFSIYLYKTKKDVPGRVQGITEVLLEGAFNFVQSVIGTEKKAKRIFPLVFTMFIFILFANLFVFIPGQSAIMLNTPEGEIPLFRAVMSDYSLVFVMTMITVILTQIVAIVASGPFGYLGKFINISGIKKFFKLLVKGKFEAGVLAQGFLDLFLGLMDIVGEVAKIISLSFRLFGNIFAGEVLSAVMLFLMPFIAPLPFMFLGLLTAVVQAFVFSVLTLIFVSMASEASHEEPA